MRERRKRWTNELNAISWTFFHLFSSLWQRIDPELNSLLRTLYVYILPRWSFKRKGTYSRSKKLKFHNKYCSGFFFSPTTGMAFSLLAGSQYHAVLLHPLVVESLYLRSSLYSTSHSLVSPPPSPPCTATTTPPTRSQESFGLGQQPNRYAQLSGKV